MAEALVSTVRINCPPEQVFAYISNFENDPKWSSEVREMRWLEPGEVRLGRQVRELSSVFGRRG